MEERHPFIKVDTKKRLVTGEVLIPETEDAQKDIASEEEIEKAAHKFLSLLVKGKLKFNPLDVMHLDPTHSIELVECYCTPVEFKIKERVVKKGTWLITTHIIDDEVWAAIENKTLTGYSIQGSYNSKVEEV